ncbi:hypothetical protein GCM10010361_15090 [Streptomyces olivaceiscleroticus]|uniref:Uncharacterized protein n=1 Tax=Streptomyces olivaceiscleroticus TaxID=68245 RepID=A0ABN0ZLM0_9ACTN
MRVAEQFVGREPVAVVVHRAGQGTEKVTARVAVALGVDEVGEVAGQGLPGRGTGLDAGSRDDLGGPAAELLAVLGGHTQEIADDSRGQGQGEGLDEVCAAVRRHRVEEFVGDLSDAGAHRPDVAAGEVRGDQPAQSGVPGWGAVEHGRTHDFPYASPFSSLSSFPSSVVVPVSVPGAEGAAGWCAGVGRPAPPAPPHSAGSPTPRRRGGGHTVHGPLLTQKRVDRVRICGGIRAGRCQGLKGRRRHGGSLRRDGFLR